MKTIETKTNIDSWIEWQNNTVNTTREGFKDSLLGVIEQWEAVNWKWAEKNRIKKQTKLELLPLEESTHSLVESELAKMFWLNWIQIAKLNEDFNEQPTTLAWVMAWAEEFWESEHLLAA